MKILLTSTSFQDTPGMHQELLKETSFYVETLRGPVGKNILLPIIKNFDGVICGDDEYTRDVLFIGKQGRLKVLSKYGVGLDKIDIGAANELGISVFNTVGINQVSVAEHTITLILTFLKNIHFEYNITKEGGWHRLIGHELQGKIIGIYGLGKIGMEFAKRISVFGVKILAYDKFYNEDFLHNYQIQKVESISELISSVQILSIHVPLNEETKHTIDWNIIMRIDKPIIIVNTSRALILEQNALIKGLQLGKISGYLTDVMDQEPMDPVNILRNFSNVLITPHIGSRTYETVVRQGIKAVENLVIGLR